MKFQDHYRILGIAPEASSDAIKTAYRKLARTHHPDVSKKADAGRRFVEIGDAYAVLKDPARRAEYDAMRASGWQEGQEMAGTESAHRTRSTAEVDPGAFADAFSFAFGGGGGGRGRRPTGNWRGGHAYQPAQERGQDLVHELPVSLEEAHIGGTRELGLATADANGEPLRRSITVTIPRGVVQGTRLRLRGQGGAGFGGGGSGDLILDIELLPHRLFQVTGSDLSLEVPIAPWEAVLGARITVPTLGGSVDVTIPPDSVAGQKLRLKGSGLPADPPGDLYLTLRLVVPASTSAAAKSLYRELAKLPGEDPRSALGG